MFGMVLLSLLAAAAPRAGAETAPPPVSGPIRLGLLPSIATLSLLRLYDPLRHHLEEALGRPVELYTAANFHSHLEAIRDGDFDLLLTAPHFGVLAYDRGYVPLFRYNQELTPLVVVPKGSAVREPGQLRGRRVVTADRLAALSVVAEAWLKIDFGLRADVDYRLEEVASHATSVRAVAIGDADAAISSPSVLQQLPEELRDRVVPFTSRLRMPHQMYLVHPRLGEETIRAVRQALGGVGETERGRAFFKSGGFKGLVPVEIADIEQARPYADLVSIKNRSGN
ncbi:ABC-type phosphate/phosphonate transport system, periplasmic component [Paramagnetospirillum caucaseum]|uniref:ABC-type phosphate/phosphonate transport system, periplasmic component n=1 Tax=Paramagnetospirillum caucaseum TaxID=1244869 RepID=M2ZK20_9PROT|nr:phosphate/phosphite/phosphonate ABC transporter substrate-binding protein [Paramagnetospirillum caucaseum]EME67642.1 ABC-type phosphate/phosphonate transport system, periplasmic component [Paramagnetospirillum caucaseum]